MAKSLLLVHPCELDVGGAGTPYPADPQAKRQGEMSEESLVGLIAAVRFPPEFKRRQQLEYYTATEEIPLAA